MKKGFKSWCKCGKDGTKGSAPVNSLPPMKSGNHAGKSTTQLTAILPTLRLPEIVFGFLSLNPRIPGIFKKCLQKIKRYTKTEQNKNICGKYLDFSLELKHITMVNLRRWVNQLWNYAWIYNLVFSQESKRNKGPRWGMTKTTPHVFHPEVAGEENWSKQSEKVEQVRLVHRN